MQQLQFTELDEGGRLVLVGDDGTRYAVPVDDRLRAALRPRPHSPTPDRTGSATSPREVQALIRAGQSAEEVAAATGWELERVRRFEGPVLAEREHVVGLAKAASVRAQGRTDGSHTLDRRVRERLQTRGVEDVAWDAARTDQQGPWTVVVAFTAGGRERRAAWHYDAQDRSIEALDDEARWLSEDEQALPGGLAGHPLLGTSTATDEANDLMATMRARRQRRGTVRRPRRAEEGTGDDGGATREPPADGGLVDEVLPIEDFDFDHASMGDPPAAHPRGSAPESPTPVPPDELDAPGAEAAPQDAGDDRADAGAEQVAGAAQVGAQDEDATTVARGASARRRRERRRLRMPKLPPAVGGPAEEDESSEEPEGTYARTRHDPHEVSFDEFFGTDEDELGDEELADDEYAEDDSDDESDDDTDGDTDDTDDELLEVEVDVAFEPDGSEEADEGDEAGTTVVDEEPGTADVGDEAAASPEQDSGARKKGRTSVPSWDDIMFGSGTRKR